MAASSASQLGDHISGASLAREESEQAFPLRGRETTLSHVHDAALDIPGRLDSRRRRDRFSMNELVSEQGE